jgi:hypothetical protein
LEYLPGYHNDRGKKKWVESWSWNRSLKIAAGVASQACSFYGFVDVGEIPGPIVGPSYS